MLGLLQVVVVIGDQLALDLAAREGARAAAVSASPSAAASGAVIQVIGDGRASTDVRVSATTVTVTVVAPVSATLPIVGTLVGQRQLTASATMALEPPDDG